MSKYEDYLQEVGKIESKTFSDAWSVQSIRDSLEHDYNALVVLLCDDSDRKYFEIYQCGKNICDISDVPESKDDDLIAGYVIFNQIADESELLRIAVDKQYQGKGFGNMLLEKYINFISGNCEKAFLEVRDSNIIAKSLYEKYGYIKIATRKQYYSNPTDDGIIYEYIPKNTK